MMSMFFCYMCIIVYTEGEASIMTIGEIIKAYRKEHRMSMDTFAEKAGISRQYVWILERGESPKAGRPSQPTMDILNRIAAAMGMPEHQVPALLCLESIFYYHPLMPKYAKTGRFLLRMGKYSSRCEMRLLGMFLCVLGAF